MPVTSRNVNILALIVEELAVILCDDNDQEYSCPKVLLQKLFENLPTDFEQKLLDLLPMSLSLTMQGAHIFNTRDLLRTQKIDGGVPSIHLETDITHTCVQYLNNFQNAR